MTLIKRTELYRLVWSEPRRLLAPKYGVSDVGLAKTCRRHDIPMPPRGYWARKAAGQSPEQIELPNPTLDIEVELHCEPLAFDPTLDRFPLTRLQDEVDRRVAFEKLPDNRLSVVGSMCRLHPLVENLNCEDLHFGRPPISFRDEPRCEVRTSLETRGRAMLLLDALCRGMEKRGFTLLSATSFKLFRTEISFRVRERSTRIIHQHLPSYREFELIPNGKLIIELKNCRTSPSYWRDSPKGLLEERLNEVMVGLTLAAANQHEWEADLAVWESQYNSATKFEAEVVVAAAADLRRQRTQISNWAREWAKSQRIRRFISAAVQNHRDGTLHWGGELPFESWVALAREHADSLDPTIGELLER